MKALFTFLAVSGIFAGWLVQHLSSARLNAELEVQRQQNAELISLRLEERRLSSRVPAPRDLAALERDAAERDRLRQATTIREESMPPASRSEFTIGDWSSSSTWTDRGRATPRAAVETALWAAAGGDTAALKNLLSLAGPTRTKAAELLAGMSESSRKLYASPEDLIASFTIKSIPLGEAQLVWFNENGPDDATVCVFLQRLPQPGKSVAPVAPRPAATKALTREEAVREALQRQAQRAANPDHEPPRAPENGNNSATYLSLHREDDGWRLVVPPIAVEKIAKEIAGLPVK